MSAAGGPSGKAPAGGREAKLAARLRENLRRRKAQARATAQAAPEPVPPALPRPAGACDPTDTGPDKA